ncbi:MAG: acyl carrier protein [Gammaproteobacteria bacterium]|nr:acyl carrier protein [Gammaproteobacteria bacterium]
MRNTMQNIWLSILGIPEHMLEKDFFDSGGDSMSAMHLILSIDQEFKIKLNIIDIFEYCTLESLTMHVDNEIKKNMSPL